MRISDWSSDVCSSDLMSRHDRTPRPAKDRTNLYDDITGKIIADLEAGRFPWVQPWGAAAASAPLAMPQNAATGRRYSGINVLILRSEERRVGKDVSVRVDLGGRRIIKKKKKKP